MDSKDVNKLVRKIIKPALEIEGFSVNMSRTFWRYKGRNINVINLQSFNSYNASVMNATTFSYVVNLGVYNQDINIGFIIKYKKEYPIPEEHVCHFRGRVKKSIKQEYKDPYLFYINEDGSNLLVCINDTLKQIKLYGLKWFEELNNSDNQFELILNGTQEMSVLWGWGHNPSPLRSLMIASLFIKKIKLMKLKII